MTPTIDKILAVVITVVAVVASTVLYLFGHEAGAAAIPVAAVMLYNQVRTQAKVTDVAHAAETHTDQLAGLMNGQLVRAVKAGFVEAMREQGYTYTDPEPPPYKKRSTDP